MHQVQYSLCLTNSFMVVTCCNIGENTKYAIDFSKGVSSIKILTWD